MNPESSSPSTFKRLEGKVAIITGGASGIGESSARHFIKQGACVVIADIQDELGLALAEQLGSEQTVSYIHCDVTSDSDVQAAVDFAVSKYGKLDIMFSNAGISGKISPTIAATENDDFKRVFEVNVYGGFLAAKHAARVMIPARTGSILFTSSNFSATLPGEMHAYVASKHALVGLAKNLSVELGKFGIRVNCVSPGAIVTALSREFTGLREVARERFEEAIAGAGNLKGAVLRGEDVAEAAVYLVSDEAKYVSGVNLVIDGGVCLTNPSLQIALHNLGS